MLTIYPIPGLARPRPIPPNATIPTSPWFFPGGYGANGVYLMQNCYGQDTIFPSPNLTLSNPTRPMFPVNEADLQQSFYTFPDTRLGTVTPPQSEVNGHHERLSQLAFQPLLTLLHMQQQAAVSPQEIQPRIDQKYHAVMEPPSTPESVQAEDSATNVAPYTIASDVSPSSEHWHNQYHPPQENAMLENYLGIIMEDVNGDERYHCIPCQKWVLCRRKTHHDKTHHSPEEGEYVCRICQILKMERKPLSRKDALKRHVDHKHPECAVLLKNIDLGILKPRKRNIPEDLRELERAVLLIRHPQA